MGYHRQNEHIFSMPIEQSLTPGRAIEAKKKEQSQRAAERSNPHHAEILGMEGELREMAKEEPSLQAESVALQLEGEALDQALMRPERKQVTVEEDGNIDYRGPEKKVEQGLEAVVMAAEKGELNHEQLGIIIEEVSRKSVKDALHIGQQTNFEPHQMLAILGRTAKLRPEDPEHLEDAVIAHLRYRSNFSDDAMEPFRQAVVPASGEREAKSPLLGEKGRQLLGELNNIYLEYTRKRNGMGPRKRGKLERFDIGHMMSREEFEAYQLVKDIAPIIQGVIEPRKMRELLRQLPIPKEVMQELEAAHASGKAMDEIEKDAPKAFSYAMSLLEKLPLFPEHKRRQDAGEPYDWDFQHAWEKQAEPVGKAIDALLKPFGREGRVKLDEAAALMELVGVDGEAAKKTLREKRTKLEVFTPQLVEAKIKSLETVKEKLEKIRDEDPNFADAIQLRIDDIQVLQEALAKGEDIPVLQLSRPSHKPGYSELASRFGNQAKKQSRKINFVPGFEEGLMQQDPAFPGFTFVAKQDVYTRKQHDAIRRYLFPRDAEHQWDQVSETQKQKKDQGKGKENNKESDDVNVEVEESQSQFKAEILQREEDYFIPQDREENIDGDPKQERGSLKKLIELSRPLDTVLVRGVFESYDEASAEWVMGKGLPAPKAERKTEPVIAKIPVHPGKVRLTVPMYGKVDPGRVVGVNADGQPVSVTCAQDEKGFMVVDVPKGSGIQEIMYEIGAPAETPALTDISQKEYQGWLRRQEGGEKKEERERIGDSLPPECASFLEQVAKEPPAERVRAIEKFVRNIGFYDIDNGELFGQKRKMALPDRLNIMRARLDDLRPHDPKLLENKIFAGVCADFQELTTAMLEASGMRAGRISGIRIAGQEQAGMSNSHALSYVEWPEVDGERQLIPVDGTPTTAFTTEVRMILQEMRRSTAREEEGRKNEETPNEKKEKKEPKLPVAGKGEGLSQEASPEEAPLSLAGKKTEEIQEKTFGEELDEQLTLEQKQEIRNVRDVLMYSPLKHMGSAWLRNPSNAAYVMSFFDGVKDVRPDENIQGNDLERMWGNVLVDWSKPDTGVDREDVRTILGQIQGKLTPSARETILRMLG